MKDCGNNPQPFCTNNASLWPRQCNILLLGLVEEGLFRLPGQAKNVADLKDAFNRGTNNYTTLLTIKNSSP